MMEWSPLIAYLDPGTGSMIVQVIVGLAVGALYAIKSYWYKILSFFGIGSSSDHDLNDVKGSEPGDEGGPSA